MKNYKRIKYVFSVLLFLLVNAKVFAKTDKELRFYDIPWGISLADTREYINNSDTWEKHTGNEYYCTISDAFKEKTCSSVTIHYSYAYDYLFTYVDYTHYRDNLFDGLEIKEINFNFVYDNKDGINNRSEENAILFEIIVKYNLTNGSTYALKQQNEDMKNKLLSSLILKYGNPDLSFTELLQPQYTRYFWIGEKNTKLELVWFPGVQKTLELHYGWDEGKSLLQECEKIIYENKRK